MILHRNGRKQYANLLEQFEMVLSWLMVAKLYAKLDLRKYLKFGEGYSLALTRENL